MVEAGGQPNQARAEGLLAVFGLKSDPVEARRAAASSAISAKVDVLNDPLADRPVAPVRFGIGVNAGNVIAGEIGCERHAQFTAIGDAVNLASRLQDLTRTVDCEALMSEERLPQGRPTRGRPARARGRPARTGQQGQGASGETGGGSANRSARLCHTNAQGLLVQAFTSVAATAAAPGSNPFVSSHAAAGASRRSRIS